MSQDPDSAGQNSGNPDSSTPEKRKKKKGITFRTKMALLEVIERKRLSRGVNYREIAIKHGVTAGSLKSIYYHWTKGDVDLGDPQTPEERAIDARVQMEKTMGLLRRYQALLIIGFEGALVDAEDAMGHGERDAWRKQLPGLRNEIRATQELITRTEEGYVAIVDEYRATEANRMKMVGPPAQETVILSKQVAHANDEALAAALLNGT